MSEPRHPPPELWGGVECTVNRVGDVWFDQMARNGHATRPDDLDAFTRESLRLLESSASARAA